MSTGPVVDAEAVEEPLGEEDQEPAEAPVRALAERRTPSELSAWRGEVRAIAVVAAGGIAAGAATVVAVSAAKAMTGGRTRRTARRARSDRDVIASRSFLVDVHLLGR
jgi:Mrp family chromosome partitioning ATPase